MPFSLVFYKWILGHEESLNLEELVHVDRNLYEQLKKFHAIVHRRDQWRASESKKSLAESSALPMAVDQTEPNLLFDGCKIEDLALVFTLPGHPNIELKKGGKDCSVNIHNLDQYVNVRSLAPLNGTIDVCCLAFQLIVHWTLVEGVRRQFESFRDGFNSIFPILHLKYFYPDEVRVRHTHTHTQTMHMLNCCSSCTKSSVEVDRPNCGT